MQQSQTDNLMETKEEMTQIDVSSDVQSWISSKKEWALFSEEEIKQYAQHLIEEMKGEVLYNEIEEYYRQPDYLFMLDEAGRTKLIEVIIGECLKAWYVNHGDHSKYGKLSSHVRAVAGQVIEHTIETEEQRNDIVDQLFKSINDEDDSSVSGLRLISEMPRTLRKLSEARQQQIVERVIKIIEAGNHEHVNKIVDVVIMLSDLLPEFFDSNRQEICAALKKYAQKNNPGFGLVTIAKILGNEVSEDIKEMLIYEFLDSIDFIGEVSTRLDLKEIHPYICGMKWLFEGRILEKKQKEIISSLMEKIRKKDDTREEGFAKACHIAAILLPRFSRVLSPEDKQEIADYSIGEFFSLMQSEELESRSIPIQMMKALMEEMPEYVSGREQDILKLLVFYADDSRINFSLAAVIHRFSAFLSGLSEDEQLHIMDWLLNALFLPFSRSEYRNSNNLYLMDDLPQPIAAIGACIKKMKPELATQWLEKTIDTLLSHSVDKFAFVDLITACLDGMTNEKKKHFLNYMHSRFLEVVGKGKKMKEKNFMGALLMISADCERKQNILTGLGKLAADGCGMFADINLPAMIDMSDGELSASSTKHNKNW